MPIYTANTHLSFIDGPRGSTFRLLLLAHVGQVVLAADALDLDSGQILHATNPHQHHVVLLQVVADSGDVRDQFLAGAEPHQDALPVGRVGLLGLFDQGLQDDALGKGFPVQGLPRWTALDVRSGAMHLVQGGHRASLQER